SGLVPVLFAVCGPVVSGPALLVGLADQVVMTADAYAFVSGPRMVRQFTGVPISNEVLGGAGTHARATGIASLVVRNREEALDALGDLLAYLPNSVDDPAPRYKVDDPTDRRTPEAGAVIPASPTGSYDVRDVIRPLVDDGEFLEIRAHWAPNLVTGFATVAGHAVGIVANQPCRIAGTLDIPASHKGARFVSFCDAFNLPLVTLIDTPGFFPGKDLEWRGMIRHGAQMAFAYARATVPRVSIALRKCYGGAYIVMDSKTMGGDLALAWPSAEIAVMGAKGAVEILHRAASPEEKLAAERDYEERLLNPYLAAERGLVDMVIDPAETRRELAAALELLMSKRETVPRRVHDNTPL
ncbi:MAG: methylmalonyl-CoA carboxyltransferase, partial [Acidimicrobiales bacterium]|nr:methylmalonyl-CoA carboxyltransferase [Acidimicrobiales bacterium]